MKVKIDASAKDLNNWIIKTNNDLKPIHFISETGKAVLIAESEWNAMVETLYLFSDLENAKVLIDSMLDTQGRAGKHYKLSEIDQLFGI